MNLNIIKKAISEAKDLKDQKFKLVAIIVDKRGNILSKGKNSFSKSHPTQAYYAEKVGSKYKIFLHAEIDAITKLKYTDDPHAIYIARTNKNGNTLLAKPCEICMSAIKDVGIKEIYFTLEWGVKNELF